MPKTPKEITELRTENTVNKLCDLIDKKLLESEEEPFRFKFLSNTSPKVQTAIAEIYRGAGWIVTTTTINDENTLCLSAASPRTFFVQGEWQSTNTKVDENSIVEIIGQKEILKSLETEEGMQKAAAAMEEPIYTSLMYQSVTRKLIMVDELPPNTLPRYTDRQKTAFFWTPNGEIKQYKSEFDTKDFTKIFAQENIKYDQFERHTIDSTTHKLRESLKEQENKILISLLREGGVKEQTIHTYGETFIRAVNDSMAALETKELIAAKMIMHPMAYRKAFMYLKEGKEPVEFYTATQRDILMTGLYGHVYSLDIHISTHLQENEVYILPPGLFLGAFAIEHPKMSTSITNNGSEFVFSAGFNCLPVIVNPEYVRKIEITW